MPIITPANGNALPATNQTPTGPSKRAAAIAAFEAASKSTGSSAQQPLPVSNPNNVSPEELSAIHPSSSSTESVEQGQKLQSEDSTQESSEVTKTKEDPISSQYAVLARKEKALRARAQQQEQALKAREAEISAREAALRTQAEPKVDMSKYVSIDEIRENLLGVAAKAGVSPEEITNSLLDQPRRDPYVIAELQKRDEQIRKLEERLEGREKSDQELQQQSYQSAIKQIRRDAQELVNSDPAFETIKETRQVGEVVKLIEKTYQEDGYVMSVEEAANLIENELIDRILDTAKIKKIQQRLKPVAPASQKQSPTQQSQQSNSQMKTLTNAVGSSRQLSAKERAILAFKGELK
jgi:hypothetical protein